MHDLFDNSSDHIVEKYQLSKLLHCNHLRKCFDVVISKNILLQCIDALDKARL